MLMANDTFSRFASDLLLGGLSAAIAKTIVAPLKTIRTALELQKTSSVRALKVTPYTGVLNCFVRMSKEQGILSLWRGNLITLCRYAPVHAFNFAFRNCYTSYIPASSREDNNYDFFMWNAVTGSLASATTQLIMHPILVCHYMSETTNYQGTDFKRLRECIQRTAKYEGIAGLYQGFYGFTIALVIYRGLYFSLYDSGKMCMKKYDVEPNIITSFILAQMATAIAGVAAYPMDTAGWRLINDSRQTNKKRKYHGVMDCWIKMYYSEGPTSFFSGCLASLLRSTVTALVLVFFDEFDNLRANI